MACKTSHPAVEIETVVVGMLLQRLVPPAEELSQAPRRGKRSDSGPGEHKGLQLPDGLEGTANHQDNAEDEELPNLRSSALWVAGKEEGGYGNCKEGCQR